MLSLPLASSPIACLARALRPPSPPLFAHPNTGGANPVSGGVGSLLGGERRLDRHRKLFDAFDD